MPISRLPSNHIASPSTSGRHTALTSIYLVHVFFAMSVNKNMAEGVAQVLLEASSSNPVTAARTLAQAYNMLFRVNPVPQPTPKQRENIRVLRRNIINKIAGFKLVQPATVVEPGDTKIKRLQTASKKREFSGVEKTIPKPRIRDTNGADKHQPLQAPPKPIEAAPSVDQASATPTQPDGAAEAEAEKHNKKMHIENGNHPKKMKKPATAKRAVKKSPKQHRKAATKSSSSSGVPFVATTTPITSTRVHFTVIAHGERYIRVIGRQLLGTLTTEPNLVTGTVIGVLPMGLSLLSKTRIYDYMRRFEYWQPSKLSIELVPSVPSTTPGQYAMWCEPDPEDVPTLGSTVDWATVINSTSASAVTLFGNIGRASAFINKKRGPFYTNNNATTTPEPRLTTPGTAVIVAGPALPASTTLGSLYIDFDILFSMPVEMPDSLAVEGYVVPTAGHEDGPNLAATAGVPVPLGPPQPGSWRIGRGVAGDLDALPYPAFTGWSLPPGTYVVVATVGVGGEGSMGALPKLTISYPGETSTPGRVIGLQKPIAGAQLYTAASDDWVLSSAATSNAIYALRLDTKYGSSEYPPYHVRDYRAVSRHFNVIRVAASPNTYYTSPNTLVDVAITYGVNCTIVGFSIAFYRIDAPHLINIPTPSLPVLEEKKNNGKGEAPHEYVLVRR